MKVDATIYYWTGHGMRRKVPFGSHIDGRQFIEKKDVERLLKEAHDRGFAEAKSRCLEFVATATVKSEPVAS